MEALSTTREESDLVDTKQVFSVSLGGCLVNGMNTTIETQYGDF